MTYEQLLYTVDGPLATITLNRPERMNALTKVLEAELRTAIDLAGGVETPMRCSDQLEIGRLFECNLRGHRQLRSGIDQLSIAKLAAGGCVHDQPLFRATG